MTPEQAKKTLLNTDYPIDVVNYSREGSLSVSQAANQSQSVLVTIPHGLGYAPLMLGSYTDDSSWGLYYPYGSYPESYSTLFASWRPSFAGVIESDSTNVYIHLINWLSTRQMYYRAIGLVPSSPTQIDPIPIAQRGRLFIDTDQNYMKIYMAGSLTIPQSGTPQTVSVSHGLGYRPTFLSWSEYDGRIRTSGQENMIGTTGQSTKTSVTNSSILFEVDTWLWPITMHYRIYLDD